MKIIDIVSKHACLSQSSTVVFQLETKLKHNNNMLPVANES